MKRIVILISGRGSNMEAIVKARLPAEVARVVSSRADAPGLAAARALGAPVSVVDHREFASREAFDAALGAAIEAQRPDVVALAGFMRILTPDFVARFRGRMLNIHPSLLPAFPGLRTHARALEAGVRIHGCTAHFVTEQLDGGPIVIQAAVPVLPQDSAETLAARVLAEEHRIYPEAIRWVLEGRVSLAGERTEFQSVPAPAGGLVSPGLST
ncbi:MAG TPA: phosphoribosylglycinamide formyltransferase [Burkholderiales bacterium]|nr:phosphoribosylglycinamide formyltransferase [Burkholderiales bacterium]